MWVERTKAINKVVSEELGQPGDAGRAAPAAERAGGQGGALRDERAQDVFGPLDACNLGTTM